MFDRFSDRARKVMSFAQQEAERFNHEYLGPEHILLGIVKEGTGVAATVLEKMRVNLNTVSLELDKLVRPDPDGISRGKRPLSLSGKKVLEFSVIESRALNHGYVGTEHLLLGILREDNSVAAQVLKNMGMKLNSMRAEIVDWLGDGGSAASVSKS